MAETPSSHADPTQAIAGETSAVDQSSEYGGKQSGSALPGESNHAIDDGVEQPKQEAKEIELERDLGEISAEADRNH